MLAVPVPQETQALATAIPARADANVIEHPHAEAVHGEAAAADVAGDFLERVERGVLADLQAEHARLIHAGGPQQANGA